MNSLNAMTLKAGSDSVMINTFNLPSNIMSKNRHLLRNVKCWHKFIVSNSDGLTRDEVLKTILDHVHPLDLIPVFYAKDPMNSNSYFLARNCEAAIEKLCQDNLTVNHPYSTKIENKKFPPLKLTIILNFSNTNDVKIDVQKNVLQALNKRFNAQTKTLNLDRFAEDPDLIEFCPLSQPKIMYFVLHIAKNLSPEEIILSNNGIKLINPLDVLIGLKLRAIDLSNNELTSLNDISGLKHFHVKELRLDGNPFCDCDEDEYISKVRLLCPTVTILDGIPLSIDKFPVTKRYFLCHETGFDLVNQFLEYYFSVYDTRDRKSLAGLYHSEAMFSLTCVYLANQLSSGSAFLKTYSSYSRNLKRAADLSKTEEFLFKGRNMIMNAFDNKLPLTEHDPYTFTVDLVHKADRCAVIVVTGVFHEIPNSLLDKERTLGFTRTFALELLDTDSKYIIVNEQLHVYNALTCQERNSFMEPITHNKLIQREFLPRPQAKTDYTELINTLGQITNLKDDWAKKCLEECEYDLKKSLELFVDLYKGDKIPKHAFVEIKVENDPINYKPDPSKTNHESKEHIMLSENVDLNDRPAKVENSITKFGLTSPIDISKNTQNYVSNIQRNVLPTSMQNINPQSAEVAQFMTSDLNSYGNSQKQKQVASNNPKKKFRGPSIFTVLR